MHLLTRIGSICYVDIAKCNEGRDAYTHTHTHTRTHTYTNTMLNTYPIAYESRLWGLFQMNPSTAMSVVYMCMYHIEGNDY